MRRVEDVGYTGHANCFNDCSQGMVRPVFKVRLFQPVMIAFVRERMRVEDVLIEEEVGPKFIYGLERRVRNDFRVQRGCDGVGFRR